MQYLMKQDSASLVDLITRKGAHVYVCGDGAAMMKDVHAALVELLKDYASMTDEAAVAELAAMTKQGRYARDIWS